MHFRELNIQTFLGVTILLSLTVFHNIVTATLPSVSDAMPLLGTKRTRCNHVCLFFINDFRAEQNKVLVSIISFTFKRLISEGSNFLVE